jgi:hypothetical protein
MPISRNDCGATASRRNVLFLVEKYILMLLCKILNFMHPRLSVIGVTALINTGAEWLGRE